MTRSAEVENHIVRRRARHRLYYAAHAEKIKAQQRDYRAANADKVNAQKRASRDANLEQERARQRARYAANREKILAQNKAIRDRDKDRAKGLYRKHGLTYDELAGIWAAQDGRCYLCSDPMMTGPRQSVIDHVHDCCGWNSCAACRRGLACAGCNKVIGFAGDDPERLHRIADNLAVANIAARTRITAKLEELE